MASQIPESDIPKYEGLLQQGKDKLEQLKNWKERVDSPTPEFEDELRKMLQYFQAAFGIFRDDKQFQRLADELAQAIVETRNHLGRSLMPLNKFHVFPRGVFEVGNQTVVSAQYYEEIPYYGPPRPAGQDEGEIMQITKFYEWKVVDCPRENIGPSMPVKEIYHLEKGEMQGPYYVLGMSKPGMHATIQMFPRGEEKPSFFQLEEMIAKRLIDQQQGNRAGFAAASFKSN